MQSFQGEGSWSSKAVTPATLCVLARWIAFCPLAEWGVGIPAWVGWLEEEMPPADQDVSVVVPRA